MLGERRDWFCIERGLPDPTHVAAAVESMKVLNRDAARLIQQAGVHACTDVTGFALLGHGYEMAEKSGVRLRFYVDKLPFLEGAMRYADEGLFPGGSCRNRDAYARHADFVPSISEETQMLLFTPETSGGLLVAVPPERLETLIGLFADEGQPIWVIGEVVDGEGIEVAYGAGTNPRIVSGYLSVMSIKPRSSRRTTPSQLRE